ncbi:Imm64 family immunity protein [Listeria seeligeri]|uniref:Imm64 family immunity protein n=1 Tax=Listeria seeligeri TaxID=1640 RepID=UPI0015E64B42|nr:Imm64 family immunity protein [Listeria seeligeri]MBF2664011.1 hypothetical protein [Listeria seeligeri]
MASVLSTGCVYKDASYISIIKQYLELLNSIASIKIENLVCYNIEKDLSRTRTLEEVEKEQCFSYVTQINCKLIENEWLFAVRFYEEKGYQGVLFDVSSDYVFETCSLDQMENKLINILIAIHPSCPYYFGFIDTEAEVDMFNNPTNIDPVVSPYATLVLPHNENFHVYLNSWKIDGITSRGKKEYVVRKTSATVSEILNTIFTE